MGRAKFHCIIFAGDRQVVSVKCSNTSRFSKIVGVKVGVRYQVPSEQRCGQIPAFHCFEQIKSRGMESLQCVVRWSEKSKCRSLLGKNISNTRFGQDFRQKWKPLIVGNDFVNILYRYRASWWSRKEDRKTGQERLPLLIHGLPSENARSPLPSVGAVVKIPRSQKNFHDFQIILWGVSQMNEENYSIFIGNFTQ